MMNAIEAILVGLALVAAVVVLVRRALRLFSGHGGCGGSACAPLRAKNRLAGSGGGVSSKRS